MDLELQKEMFADHIATLKDYGDIKVLDFQKPESNYYRIRFIFEDDHDRVHISGDLGELIAYSYAGLNFRNFIDWCRRDSIFFKLKVKCSSHPLYTYDRELAEKQLLQMTKDNYQKKALMFLMSIFWLSNQRSDSDRRREWGSNG